MKKYQVAIINNLHEKYIYTTEATDILEASNKVVNMWTFSKCGKEKATKIEVVEM